MRRSLPAIGALLWREVVRFLRQRNRVAGALLQPIMFWALFGAGLGPSFRPPVPGGAVPYTEYFFPGVVVMILLFTAIFSTVSVIEDRREGFLQSVLVAPIPRSALVLGKVLGGTALAMGQGLVLLFLAPFAHFPLSVSMLAVSFVVLAPYLPYAGTQPWGSDFMPACHQGTRVQPGREPVRDLVRRSP